MTKIQTYSNKNFNRASELRESFTKPKKELFIPIYKEEFFILETINTIVMNTPVELLLLSDRKYFLGIINETEIWCIDLSEIDFTIITKHFRESKTGCVRNIDHLITKEDASLLAYAKGITNWNIANQFCNNCGSKTILEEKGHRRKCQNQLCETLHFPRINPAIIVLIEFKQKNKPSLCLLNMHKKEDAYMCSLFSGFSEIGESFEDTVKRETMEEINVVVNNIKYIASQPWPFPSSLMVGFTAETSKKEFIVDNKEIKEAKWLSAKEINQMVLEKKLIISKKDSISNYMIEMWVKQNS